MNYWNGSEVRLRLSNAGREALEGMFDTQTGQPGFIQVFVKWSDSHGLWIVRGKQNADELSVMLIRWHHFETAELDVTMAPQATPRLLGFKR